jgi:hypothetical protein
MNIDQCNSEQRTRLAIFFFKRDPEKEDMSSVTKNENVTHRLIKCSETQRWWE